MDYAPIPASSVDDAGTDGIFFVEGKWRATEEYFEAAEDGARVLLPLFARDVFFVAASGTGGPVSVQLLLNGKPVPAAARADDASGGVVHVNRSDLYSLLRLPESNTVVLTLVAEKGFRLYTFTFG